MVVNLNVVNAYKGGVASFTLNATDAVSGFEFPTVYVVSVAVIVDVSARLLGYRYSTESALLPYRPVLPRLPLKAHFFVTPLPALKYVATSRVTVPVVRPVYAVGVEVAVGTVCSSKTANGCAFDTPYAFDADTVVTYAAARVAPTTLITPFAAMLALLLALVLSQ
jgi:hypothetical protein